ncbi:LysR substrate-binding domain-containing protein [Plantactinospora sp. KBS50]|uniref:LysR substrate-binding domain-containing protein n=1 Tax=Plantactinospora sp. KBS50 TaxID=2024580 RepID=UPI000BAB205F|nr:LysR substrate-binding domain-containing protein [Plantactinospora sp. KBS50]ASW56525.1 hypothetical protein CIK06_23750 [Plantactinospora sp. KBS50]
MASASYLPPAIAHLRRRVPTAVVTAREDEPTRLLEDLEEGNLDIAVIFDDPRSPLPIPESINYHFVSEEDLLLGLPSGHRLASHDLVSVESLAMENWIAGVSRLSNHTQLIRNTCRRAGFEPRIAVYSNSFALSQRLIAAGVGLSLVPASSAHQLRSGVVCRPVDMPPRRRIGIASRCVNGESEPFQEMIEIVLDACSTGLPARHLEPPAAAAA